MIKLLEHDKTEYVTENFDKINIFVTKILSNLLTYADSGCLLTWVSGKSAIYQKLDNSGVLFCNDFSDIDTDELKNFIRTVGGNNIFTTKAAALKLGFNIISGGIIMKKQNYTSPVSSGFKPPPFPEYTTIYNLLKSCSFTLPPKDAFLSDLIYRTKKSTARIFADDDYSSVALTAFESPFAAVISAVAVKPHLQNNGFGSAILNAICISLDAEKKAIFLYRNYDENEHFYHKNGFENCGEFVICKI